MIQQGYSTRRTELQSLSNNSNNLNTQQNRMLLCKFHQNNNLHTFCISPQCMLPMCSLCISMHNQDHKEMKNHGNYVSLYQLIRDTVHIIQECQSGLQQMSQEYVEDYGEKKKIRENCKFMIGKAKSKVHQQIDRMFDRIVLDLDQKLSNFQETMHQLYSHLQKQMHTFYKDISKQKTQLKLIYQNNSNMTKRMNTNSFGSTPRTLMTSFQQSKNQQSQQSNRKQDHKILKTLIQFYSNNQNQINISKILKMKQQIKQLKNITLGIDVDFVKLHKNIKNIIQNCVQIKSNPMNNSKGNINVAQSGQMRNSQGSITSLESKKQTQKLNQRGMPQFKGNTPTQVKLNQNQNNMHNFNSNSNNINVLNNNKHQINQIMHQTNERLKKMQIQSKKQQQFSFPHNKMDAGHIPIKDNVRTIQFL